MRAVDRAILTDGPDEPVTILSAGLDAGLQLFALSQGPGSFSGLAHPFGDLSVERQAHPYLEGDEQAFAVIAELQAIVPVGRSLSLVTFMRQYSKVWPSGTK